MGLTLAAAAAPTPAQTAALLRNDNRAVVAGPDGSTASDLDDLVVASGAAPANFHVVPVTGPSVASTAAAYTGATGARVKTAAAYKAVSGPSGADRARFFIDLATGPTGPGRAYHRYVRTQWFHVSEQGKSPDYDPSKPGFGAKMVYTNRWGEPLDESGVPVASAADALDAQSDTPLAPTSISPSNVGPTGSAHAGLYVGPVTNYAQPGPLPGDYDVPAGQSGYSPYVGWTAQNTPRVVTAP